MEDNQFDEFSKHEALDRASLILDMFSTYVDEHPYVKSSLYLQEVVDRAGNALYDAYRAISVEIDKEA